MSEVKLQIEYMITLYKAFLGERTMNDFKIISVKFKTVS